MKFTIGDRVVASQQEFGFIGFGDCGWSVVGLAGTVQKINVRGNKDLCSIDFDGAGNQIVDCCILDLLVEDSHGTAKRLQEQA